MNESPSSLDDSVTAPSNERSVSSPLVSSATISVQQIPQSNHRYRSSLTIAPTADAQVDIGTSTSIATTPSANSSPFTAVSPTSSSVSSFECMQSDEKALTQRLTHLSISQSTNNHNDQQRYSDSTLFVGALAAQVGIGQLTQLFKPFGVISVDIKRDKQSKASLGYAFVVLNSRDAAVRAKTALTGRVLHNRAIRIGFAHQNSTLFVGNISDSLTLHDLREAFRPFGELIDEMCFIKFGKQASLYVPRSRYALVCFVKREDAERAKQAMHGQHIAGRPIRVAWGDSSISKSTVQISVNPLTHSTFPSQTALIEKLRSFGRVINLIMPQEQSTSNQLVATAYFDESQSGEQSAAAAISSLNGRMIDDVHVSVSYGRRTPHHRPPPKRNQIHQQPIAPFFIAQQPANPYHHPMYNMYQPMYYPAFDPSYAPSSMYFPTTAYPNYGYAIASPAHGLYYGPVTASQNDGRKNDEGKLDESLGCDQPTKPDQQSQPPER